MPAPPPKFWRYFLAVEADLAACARFVEFSEKNYTTFSNEFAKILVLAGSELDSVLRELCDLIDSGTKADNILKYHAVVNGRFQSFSLCEVELSAYGIRLQPWASWSLTSSPTWWGKGFNKIKHDRSAHFGTASLYNALNAVGALLLAIVHYQYQVTGGGLSVPFDQNTRLFSLAREPNDQSGVYWSFELPRSYAPKRSDA